MKLHSFSMFVAGLVLSVNGSFALAGMQDQDTKISTKPVPTVSKPQPPIQQKFTTQKPIQPAPIPPIAIKAKNKSQTQEQVSVKPTPPAPKGKVILSTSHSLKQPNKQLQPSQPQPSQPQPGQPQFAPQGQPQGQPQLN